MRVERKCKNCQTWFVRAQRWGRGVFCSRRCNAIWKNKLRPLTTADRRKGARKSAETRRAMALEKLKNLTPVEIYRKGYAAGWHRGVRYARGIVRAEDAA